jgi:rfaE bifunctional protein kinase chain/domain
MDFQDLFQKFSTLKVGIIGDVMLDSYIWGNVDRISPEAPVPIVSLHHKEQRIGGAGNVALNVQSLGAKAFVLSVTGDDEDSKQLYQLFAKNNIDISYSVSSASRITTNKTRIISRNQHMMRLDAEHTHDLSLEEEGRLLDLFEKFVREEKPDIVILEDYNKGVLTQAVIQSVISICREARILTAVDPKRKNFFEYRNVNIFKPNLKEVKDALNLLSSDVDHSALQNIHLELNNLLKHQISFITLSEKGVFYHNKLESGIIPSHLRSISDVSGAGDTVIATASVVYAATKNVQLMAEIANIAGGLVCEEVGTVAINKEKLFNECELLLDSLKFEV